MPIQARLLEQSQRAPPFPLGLFRHIAVVALWQALSLLEGKNHSRFCRTRPAEGARRAGENIERPLDARAPRRSRRAGKIGNRIQRRRRGAERMGTAHNCETISWIGCMTKGCGAAAQSVLPPLVFGGPLRTLCRFYANKSIEDYSCVGPN